MRTALILAGLLLPAACSAQTLRFVYTPNEGDGMLSCRHERIRDLPDWDVVCGDKGEKRFTVHLVVRQMTRAEEPRALVDILYWVSEPPVSPSTSAFTFAGVNREASAPCWTFLRRLGDKGSPMTTCPWPYAPRNAASSVISESLYRTIVSRTTNGCSPGDTTHV